ncbi:methionine adenosyltransferase [Candidatus Campbellbacteria bacterium CG22_combo_CG10-13_8_21_14_all_36_13]|uniref:methionine adenosyltransferase n=1 Tax=Candidatus Campbellbacteria bacterium CG22_combo_CG10-13_8_21_14_all_36_13 TaxID=1974529 RepID=A0A2H0DY91_9BACT|nr:MAG: methionine adenosyltransferase [Candidatus Campbellbacteria bacterium CG22_combo_CG10-13_8_21_14_all_36_13]
MKKTCEFVSPMHPDKICDRISDAILDAYLEKDPDSRVALETMGGHGCITLKGEITSFAEVDTDSIVKRIVGDGFEIIKRISKQSPQIAQGVDSDGAGDQGIMVGFATSLTQSRMPLEYELARNLCREIFKVYPYDGKTQVTIDGNSITTVVASFQNTNTVELEKLVRSLIKADEYYINPAGEWDIGGFDADTGLTGRKIVVDAYGPNVMVGGGAFSGKDATKVDRSGAYMARHIALKYLEKYNAKEVRVHLAYAIGKREALMKSAFVDDQEIEIEDFDVSPRAIISLLDLKKPQYEKTAEWGHFGNGFGWDNIQN